MIAAHPATRNTRNVTWLTLATSASTLLCCALQALLVALGAGAVLASFVSAVPQLVWLSGHKNEVFVIAGVMLAAAGAMQWRARSLPCPIDPGLAQACMRSRKISLAVSLFSVAIFLIGGFFAFIVS